MQRLGVQAYRFSVAWPRLLPKGRGAANEPGLAFYDRLIDALLAADIEPWLCLYHWDLPQALDDRGGWTNRDAAGWFADYAALVARRYGDRVKRFATFNEPSVFTLFGYGFGDSAPGRSGLANLLPAIHHVNLAHGAAAEVLARPRAEGLDRRHPQCPAMPALDAGRCGRRARFRGLLELAPSPTRNVSAPIRRVSPARSSPISVPAILRASAGRSTGSASTTIRPSTPRPRPEAPLGFSFGPAPADLSRTPIQWPIRPEAFRETLLEVSTRYRLPVYVLENGYGGHDTPNAAGDIEDQPRIDFLKAYTDAMLSAIADGADIRGYFVWSLLDNFEWGSGYGVRFGLVYVDYPTQGAHAEVLVPLVRGSDQGGAGRRISAAHRREVGRVAPSSAAPLQSAPSAATASSASRRVATRLTDDLQSASRP